MRAVLVSAVGLLIPLSVSAADLDFGALRGSYGGSPDSAQIADFSGVYFGGTGGATQSNVSAANATQPLLAKQFRFTTLEDEARVSSLLRIPSKDSRDVGYGAFAGYNYQMGEFVLGIEADYTWTQLKQSGSDSISRTIGTSNGYSNGVTLTGKAVTEITDYGTLRGRVGYVIGSAMPFLTFGGAISQLKTQTSVTSQNAGFVVSELDASKANFATNGKPLPVRTYGYDTFDNLNGTGTRLPPVAASTSKSTVAVGFSAGVGLDLLLTPNIFLRGEYQYAYFDDNNGHKYAINAVRGGGGLKF